MVHIAEHHIPGTTGYAIGEAMGRNVDYSPRQPWPDHATVQWGNGIIPANPFFEAFVSGTFLRGDADTIEAAEADAYLQYKTFIGCDHVWSRHSRTRGTYTNGAGWCVKCGSFKSKVFEPIVTLGSKRRPISKSELFLLEEDAELDAIMDAKYPSEIERRKKSKRERAIRKRLFGVKETFF